jgi:hydroxyquinol 1,2-dioxygenase
MSGGRKAKLIEAVLEGLRGARDDRLREIMASLVRHLHAFVRETALTEAEWLAGIRFLTATGQKCDDTRQEFILLSDALGVSMAVDAVNHPKPTGATETTVLGPFYVAGSTPLPMWADIAAGAQGMPAYVSGRVTDLGGRPIAGATLDVWQTDEEGLYGVQRFGAARPSYARGKFTTDAGGRYGFRTVRPVSYSIPTDGPVGAMLAALGRHPYRPAHVHTLVSAPRYQPITTHLFVAGDRYLDSDAVYAVKPALVVTFEDRPPGPTPDGDHSSAAFCAATYDFTLVEDGPTP